MSLFCSCDGCDSLVHSAILASDLVGLRNDKVASLPFRRMQVCHVFVKSLLSDAGPVFTDIMSVSCGAHCHRVSTSGWNRKNGRSDVGALAV